MSDFLTYLTFTGSLIQAIVYLVILDGGILVLFQARTTHACACGLKRKLWPGTVTYSYITRFFHRRRCLVYQLNRGTV